ncbi:charged multivesicular body protein 7-like isoform X1 [Haliotis cracherodii]|uniref:charged multivesicular body protein 7-like isoform X1 n=1 Tax=Haliotis cracherodii TaxID=6455 RepID=UPI0039ECA8E7
MSSDKLFLPPEWKDDQKMTVLFAPFRDRSLNPQSWDRKLKFWTHVISEDCRQNNRIIVDVKELQSRFVRNGKKPGCLDVVGVEMQRSGKLHKVSQYQKAGSSSWLGWGFSTFVWRPMTWGLSAVWRKSEDNSEPLVLHQLLTEKCSEILCLHYDTVEHESTDNLVELGALRSKHASLGLSERDFDLVIQQLALDKKVVVTQTMERDTVVKFSKKGDKRVGPVSEVELNVFRIQKVQLNLEKQTEVLSQQCDKLRNEAKLHVKEGKRTLALQSLRRKKRVEQTLNQKMASIDQLHNMMTKIQDAATNEMILKAYDSGMSAIKSLNQETPVEKVENVVDNLQDALEDQGEITQLISQDLSSSDASEDGLEKELSDLLFADQQAMKEEGDDLASVLEGLAIHDTMPDLPDVPSFSPSKEETKQPRGTTLQKPMAATN